MLQWSLANPGSVQVESFELKPAMFDLKTGDTIELEVVPSRLTQIVIIVRMMIKIEIVVEVK